MRPIDADALKEDLKELEFRCRKMLWSGSELYVEALVVIKNMIDSVPTITQPPNTPLTLEELREMDGEPVYCRSILTGKEGWAICRITECDCEWYLAFSGGEQAYGDKDTIGRNWIAYRRKPEEGR